MAPKKRLRNSKGKEQNEVFHFSNRFKERLNRNINDNQYKQIINRIQKGEKEGKVKHIKTQSNIKTIWAMMFEGQYIKVIYNKKRKTLVTVVPLLNPPTLSELIGERSLT